MRAGDPGQASSQGHRVEGFCADLEKHNLSPDSVVQRRTPGLGGMGQGQMPRGEPGKPRPGRGGQKLATLVTAKTLCIPIDQPEIAEGTICIASGLLATCPSAGSCGYGPIEE